jgi:hypothetical protein
VQHAGWVAFVSTWWARFHDGEVSGDDLFLIALEVEGFGLGKRWNRSRRTRFAQLLGECGGQVIGGYRITPNRTVRGVQRWRLLPALGEPVRRAPGPVAAFIPSAEWQVVPDGYVCPPGGEFNMNVRTGVILGRWPRTAEAS